MSCPMTKEIQKFLQISQALFLSGKWLTIAKMTRKGSDQEESFQLQTLAGSSGPDKKQEAHLSGHTSLSQAADKDSHSNLFETKECW